MQTWQIVSLAAVAPFVAVAAFIATNPTGFATLVATLMR
jgi:hypothetical protein